MNEAEKLISLLEEKIKVLESTPNLTYVPIPKGIEEKQYIEFIAELSKNQYFLHFMSVHQHRIMTELSTGKSTAENCKGQMSVIGQILMECTRMREMLEAQHE